MSRGKRLAVGAGLAVFGAVVALVAAELAVRVFAPQPPLMYWPDPTLGWAHPANADVLYPGNEGPVRVRFNSRGLRDVERPYAKPAGAGRILVLGDSFTEAVDVELDDTFARRLERCLGMRGRAVEVVNAGVGGYGTDQEWLFLEREGWKYQPDLVMLAFTVVNDVYDNAGKGYCRETASGLACAPPPARRGIVYAKAVAQKYLQSYAFVQGTIAKSRVVERTLARLSVLEVSYAADAGEQWPVELRMLLRDEPAQRAHGWRLTEGLLAEMQRFTRARGARLMIVLVPSELQVDPAALERALVQHGVPAPAVDVEGPNRRLAAFAAAHDIPFVDLAVPLRRAVARGARPFDGHWNRAGHAVVAEALCGAVGDEWDRGPANAVR